MVFSKSSLEKLCSWPDYHVLLPREWSPCSGRQLVPGPLGSARPSTHTGGRGETEYLRYYGKQEMGRLGRDESRLVRLSDGHVGFITMFRLYRLNIFCHEAKPKAVSKAQTNSSREQAMNTCLPPAPTRGWAVPPHSPGEPAIGLSLPFGWG